MGSVGCTCSSATRSDVMQYTPARGVKDPTVTHYVTAAEVNIAAVFSKPPKATCGRQVVLEPAHDGPGKRDCMKCTDRVAANRRRLMGRVTVK